MKKPRTGVDYSPDKLYTLEEAKVELSKEECRTQGHTYIVYVDDKVDQPTRVQCGRCYKQWPIERGDDEAKEGKGGEATTTNA